MKRRKRSYRALYRRTPSAAPKQTAARPAHAPSRARAAAQPISVNQLRVVICGAVFVTLVGLKLLLPGGMANVRRTLGSWLVRDADFVAAFSAVGHAVSGEGGVLDALDDAYVAVFGEQEAVEVAERVELEEPPYPEHAAAEQRVLGFDYAAPLAGEITSPFGWREHPATLREAFHYGVDIAADEGADVKCFADGTVGVVGESVELGKYLTVHHDNGVVTLYAHLSRVTARSGAKVAMGDKLAEAGHTGNATGTHLHFEIHDGEEYLNPQYYLS